MYREDGKVYMDIELELLADYITLPEGERHKAVPRNEEMLSFTQGEGLNFVYFYMKLLH
jgi:hypothetical protein